MLEIIQNEQEPFCAQVILQPKGRRCPICKPIADLCGNRPQDCFADFRIVAMRGFNAALLTAHIQQWYEINAIGKLRGCALQDALCGFLRQAGFPHTTNTDNRQKSTGCGC